LPASEKALAQVYCAGGDSQIRCNGSECYCPNGGRSYLPPPADPRIAQRQRFQAIVQSGLIGADVVNGYNIKDDRQFAEALSRVHDVLSRSIASWNGYAAYYAAQSAVEMYIHENFYAPRFSHVDAAGSLDFTVRKENQEAKDELAGLQREIERRNALRERFVYKTHAVTHSSKVLNEIATQTKKWIVVYLGGLSKDDVAHSYEAAGSVPAKPSCCRETPLVLPARWIEAPSAPSQMYIAVDVARKSADAAASGSVPPLRGDMDAQLGIVEAAVARANAASKAYEASKSHYEKDVHDWYTVSDAKTWNSITEINIPVMRETHRLTEVDIPHAKIELQWSKNIFKSDAYEFLTNGGEAAAWTCFRKYYVEPEVKRLALEYQSARQLSDAEVEHAWNSGTFDILKTQQRATNSYELFNQTVSLAHLGGDHALTVARMLGSANQIDVKEVGDRLFADVEDAARQEVRTALSQADIPFALKKFWEAYFIGTKPNFKDDQ
jgi:hypothetical protein